MRGGNIRRLKLWIKVVNDFFFYDGAKLALFLLAAILMANLFHLQVIVPDEYVQDNVCINYEDRYYDTQVEREIRDICDRKFIDPFGEFLLPLLIWSISGLFLVILFVASFDGEYQKEKSYRPLIPRISGELYLNYLCLLGMYMVYFATFQEYLQRKSDLLATNPSDLEIVENFPEAKSILLVFIAPIYLVYLFYSINNREDFLQTTANKTTLTKIKSVNHDIKVMKKSGISHKQLDDFSRQIDDIERNVQIERSMNKSLKREISKLKDDLENAHIELNKKDKSTSNSQNITYNIQDSVIIDTTFDNSISDEK